MLKQAARHMDHEPLATVQHYRLDRLSARFEQKPPRCKHRGIKSQVKPIMLQRAQCLRCKRGLSSELRVWITCAGDLANTVAAREDCDGSPELDAFFPAVLPSIGVTFECLHYKRTIVRVNSTAQSSSGADIQWTELIETLPSENESSATLSCLGNVA